MAKKVLLRMKINYFFVRQAEDGGPVGCGSNVIDFCNTKT